MVKISSSDYQSFQFLVPTSLARGSVASEKCVTAINTNRQLLKIVGDDEKTQRNKTVRVGTVN